MTEQINPEKRERKSGTRKNGMRLMQTPMPLGEFAELKQDAEDCIAPMTAVVRVALQTQRRLARLAAEGWTFLPPSLIVEQAMPIESVGANHVLGNLIDRSKKGIEVKVPES